MSIRCHYMSCTFKEVEKQDIETVKPNIDDLKADIEAVFQPKTVSYILKLRETFPGLFGSWDVRPTSEMARLFYMGTIHIDANRPQVGDDLQIIFKTPWGQNNN